jgi:hypothetical protein
VVVAGTLAFGATSCAFDDVERSGLPPIGAARDAAIGVRADGCGPRTGLGTGSMIDERLAVTAAHVVAGSDLIELSSAAGETTAADVVSFDPDLDLAVLRVDEPIGEALPLRVAEARVGEVGVVALPQHTADPVAIDIATVRVLRTVNIRTTDIYLDDPVERAGFEIEAQIDPGDSGAVVVLPGGGAGVIWARSNQRDARAWAVDLPPELADPEVRGRLADPATPLADVGGCTRAVDQTG